MYMYIYTQICVNMHTYVYMHIVILKVERWASSLYFPREETVKIKLLNENERDNKETEFKILEIIIEIEERRVFLFLIYILLY